MTTAQANAYPIVGIGASAGGVEALGGFFRGLPDEPGVAVVIVTHLNPERESKLHEVVAHHTRLPVEIAAGGTQVEKNHVYVLPADGILGIQQGRLQIRKQNASRPERKPVDIFFSSLAADHGELAVGIILSGGDGDGTLGIKAIKERGGLTLAQVGDGFGPAHPDMPDSAIASGFVDLAIPVTDMGARLVEFARSVERGDDTAAHGGSDGPMPDQARLDIYAILRNQIGHDFSGYKTRTFVRRVQRRMQINGLETTDGYIERLRQDQQEVAALFRDLLINVTSFFRDAEAFDSLAQSVIPRLFEGRGANDSVRVWVPGCSTGEEVFSLAILLREHMGRLTAVPRVQVFATDIDERALVVARAARYPEPLLEGVSPERRKRFFIPDGGSYIISKEVREVCIFSPHSLIRDPPFSRIDLISCRNLLIYFGVDVQNQVIPTFHYALRPDGFLFLGSAENVTQFDDLFVPLDKKHRIFRRRSDVTPRIRLPLAMDRLRSGQATEHGSPRPPLGAVALRQAIEIRVLERFAPPHVVVNRDGDVVYYSARTGKYLEAAPGAPTRQILTIARKGLRLDLRTLLREAMESGRAVVRAGVPVEAEDGRVQMVDLTVEPLSTELSGEPLFLVLFADQGPVLSREDARYGAQSFHDGTAMDAQRELRETRDRLQSLIEEYETALEELKSSNEELVSLNEEMQSTNEELEASKEELQSVNEELHTVNAELSRKVDALDRANSDLENLFESTDVATVFLDRDLVIRSFTPAVTRLFNVLPADRGRPITDLSVQFLLPGFTEDIASVFAGQGSIERRADDRQQTAHYLVRLAPYRGSDQQIQGVVITFIDVTELIRAEKRQRLLIAELQHRTRNLLSLVQSIARQTLGKGPAVKAFTDRLVALGRVQGLVNQHEDEMVDLREIIDLELQALGNSAVGKVTMDGDPVRLDLEHIQNFGLVVHELATNAVKHGALKDGAGQLEIGWKVENDPDDIPVLKLEWRESGVPMPRDAAQRGFGRDLIERALPYTLHAKTDFRFNADGILCRIELPLGPAKS